MVETIPFHRWVIQTRQLIALVLMVGGAFLGVKLLIWFSPTELSFHSFAGGSIITIYMGIVMFRVAKDPGEY